MIRGGADVAKTEDQKEKCGEAKGGAQASRQNPRLHQLPARGTNSKQAFWSLQCVGGGGGRHQRRAAARLKGQARLKAHQHAYKPKQEHKTEHAYPREMSSFKAAAQPMDQPQSHTFTAAISHVLDSCVYSMTLRRLTKTSRRHSDRQRELSLDKRKQKREEKHHRLPSHYQSRE